MQKCIYFVFFILMIMFYSQKCITFASRFEKRCKININFLNMQIMKAILIKKQNEELVLHVGHDLEIDGLTSSLKKFDDDVKVINTYKISDIYLHFN